MAVQLPGPFAERMEALLGEEYQQFIKTYEAEPAGGIRVNTLKLTVDEWLERSPFELAPVPWCPSGFYTAPGVRPGKHPYYHAGLYYIQEPSAMAPGELLGAVPGDRVLDLCAAPGGKSTQIAAKLQGQGLLVSNDLHPDRTKALAKNLELYGVRNAVVLNETPERIASAFPGFFDRVLVDAPCSGEGMFRKDEDMHRQWDEGTPGKYADMQREILRSAAKALAPGGTLVYSTCTFAPEENEGMILAFLREHPEFEVQPVPEGAGYGPGLTDWPGREPGTSAGSADESAADEARRKSLRGTARLWPHKVKGEGHFAAVLRHIGEGVDRKLQEGSERGSQEGVAPAPAKGGGQALHAGPDPHSGADRRGEANRLRGEDRLRGVKDGGGSRPGAGGRPSPAKGKTASGRSGQGGRDRVPAGAGGRKTAGRAEQDPYEAFLSFAGEQLTRIPEGHPVRFGDHLYLSPLPAEALNGLKTVRPGWYMGQAKNGRFIPGHPLAAALSAGESVRVLDLTADGGEAVRYLKGETLEVPAGRLVLKQEASPKGYVLICIDGYAAGWGKWQDGLLKNEYPAGWRWT